ncbi:unnamed protein product [Lymnaea stagnalis]|uniref:EF-hand domain-containing protein n=1 Tax=Lymnaea stagnalis TaxID=6523 RepID=A0AAV2I9Y9_LYMST
MLAVPWFLTHTIQGLCRFRQQDPLVNEAVQQQQQQPIKQQQQQNQQQLKSAVIPSENLVSSPVSRSQASKVSTPKTQTLVASSPPGTDIPAGTQKEQHISKQTSSLQASQPVTPSTQTSSRKLVLTPSASEGKMSLEWAQQQVDKFKFSFDDADTDKSGTLSFSEVYQVLQKVGFKGSEQEAQLIFGHLDRDHDKRVTREEFAATLNNLPRLTIKEFCLRKAFLQLDKDKSGYLTRAEIEDATKSEAGLNIAAEKISDLLIYLCKEDADQKVSYEEFLRVFGVQQEATVMRQIFSKLDADKSGFLSKEEILESVKSEFELKLKASKIADLLCYWCKDADKKISYEEFVQVWLKQEEKKK